MPFARHDFTPEELKEQLDLERRGASFLLFRDADARQQIVTLAGERISVGRDGENDVALPWDREVSRIHALLERLGGHWTVVDDQLSRNGTFVNGNRVRGRRRLDDRDLLTFGTSIVWFRDPSGTGAETPPLTSRAEVAGVSAAQRRVLVALCQPFFAAGDDTDVPPSNPEIAQALGLSVEAVRTHLKSLFRLFDVPTLPQNRKRAELARRAMASGVVTSRDLSD